jgi:hypothetical protein
MMKGGGYIHQMGALLLVYGVIKVSLVILLLFVIPPHVQERLSDVPGMNMLITGDDTISGKGGEIVLALFGLFAIIHGVVLMGYAPDSVSRVFESKWFQYSIYGIFGVALIVFYSLVLYTDLPIPKRKDKKRLYWTYAYLGGVSFLAIPVLWEISMRLIPHIARLSLRGQLAYITLLFLLVMVIGYIVIMYIPVE